MIILLSLLLSMSVHQSSSSDPAETLKRRTYTCQRVNNSVYCGSTYGVNAYRVMGDQLQLVGSVKLPDSVNGLAIQGDFLLAACGNAGVQAISIKHGPEKMKPTALMQLNWNVMDVSVYGDEVYLALGTGGVMVLWFNGVSFKPVKHVAVPESGDAIVSYVRSVTPVDGRQLAVAAGLGGLLVLDMKTLEPVNTFKTEGEVRQCHWDETAQLLACADGHKGVLVYGLEGDQLTLKDKAATIDQAHGVFITAGRVHVADGAAGVLLFPVDASGKLGTAKQIKTTGATNKITAGEHWILLANDYYGPSLKMISDDLTD